MSVSAASGTGGSAAAEGAGEEPISLELDEIQGLAVFGYHLPLFRFYFLRIGSPDAGRKWIGRLLGDNQITMAVRQNDKPHPCLNVGFTHAGLAALGLAEPHLSSFDPEFREGIEKRAVQLGDTGASDPQHWAGGLGTSDLHAVLMVFAATTDEFEQVTKTQEGLLAAIGDLRVLSHQDAAAFPPPDEAREHFGFRDGISRITLEGSGTVPLPGQPLVKPGEFVLGYPDETGQTPALAHPELMANGTFLVYRKLEQDVVGFRRWVEAKSRELKMKSPELLMAKLVGRWPSGAPLVVAQKEDQPELGENPEKNADFDYADADPKGFACPVGSHIRRANPRGTLGEGERKRHLLMRRGLCYGPPLPPGAAGDAEKRGIAGVFVNASISRQFEFVQQHWLNDRKLSGQTVNDKDPICGDHDGTSDFTIPAKPFAKKLRGMPRFTTVRGGAYFFAPGLKGLKFLAGTMPAERGVPMVEDVGAAAETSPAAPATTTTDATTNATADAATAGAAATGGGRLAGDIHNYITSIVRVIPERLPRLKMVLAALADPSHDSPVPKVGTIHFARWALIDDDTRLLFTTNFDQSWDAYIEKFVEIGSAGLDAIWSNCEGYPAGGSKELEAFKQFVRSTECSNAFVYCAYPDSTVEEVQSSLRAKRKFTEFLEEFQA